MVFPLLDAFQARWKPGADTVCIPVKIGGLLITMPSGRQNWRLDVNHASNDSYLLKDCKKWPKPPGDAVRQCLFFI